MAIYYQSTTIGNELIGDFKPLVSQGYFCPYPISRHTDSSSYTVAITIIIPLFTVITAIAAALPYFSKHPFVRYCSSLRLALLAGLAQALDAFLYFFTGTLLTVDSSCEDMSCVKGPTCPVNPPRSASIRNMKISRQDALEARIYAALMAELMYV